jgi:hypothetical protein
VVYAKRPFGGPEAVLAYLARYTHRVAISNSRLLAMDQRGVSFRWKDYRTTDPSTGAVKIKTMTLPAHEFLRRVLLHVLPRGFHRIRHYGLLAAGARADIARVRALIEPLAPDTPLPDHAGGNPPDARPELACPCCGARMRIVETFAPGQTASARPAMRLWADTS